MGVFWGLVSFALLIIGFGSCVAVVGADSSSQQTAGAAIGIAAAVILYCFARAVTAWRNEVEKEVDEEE